MRAGQTTNAADEVRCAVDRALQDAYQRGLRAGREETLGGKVVKARAWITEEGFGYDHWKASEYSLGLGTHEAFIVIIGPCSEFPAQRKDIA